MTDAPYVILVALQFDETGDLALQAGTRIAQRDPRAELHLLHVVTPSLVNEPAYARDKDAETLQSLAPLALREYVDRACAGSDIEVIAHVRRGNPLDMILETASDLGADLLVLGTHHRRGLEKLMLGSVAERVVRDARCSVMIATPSQYTAMGDLAEPPCPECVAARAESGDPSAWCDRHSRMRLRPHVYTPTEPPRRESVLG